MSMAVLASGQGSNFEVIAQNFPAQICALICNVEGAGVIQKAHHFNIPAFIIPHKNYSSRALHEQEILKTLSQFDGLKIIVLAGYMRVLTPTFFNSQAWLAHKLIVNLHPAHLDEYKGAHAYEYAVAHKYPRWGLSIHKVTAELDSGELLSSCELPVLPYESSAQLHERARKLEHNLLINTLKHCLNNKEDFYV